MKITIVKTMSATAFALFCFAKMQAQVQPPDFLCVRGDTLFWDLPANNCGLFLGYEVWASQDEAGPYALIATVTNQAQDFYPFTNPSGEQWFFYLVSSYNCPGQASPTSDTLDNRPPVVSPIVVATVEGGLVNLSWTPSPSPEVSAYVIYRETAIGVVPVDTVSGITTYTDMLADPTAGPQSYFVNALDPCGNTSIFDQEHTSIFAMPTLNPCRQSATLNWNPYQNWQGGIAEQQIWASKNGNAPALVADAGPSASSFEVPDLTDGATYCFTVRAVQAGSGTVAKSNEVCLTADVVASAKGLQLRNVSVTSAGEVEVTWAWPTDAELTEFQVQRSDMDGGYQPIQSQAPALPLVEVNSFTDGDSGAAEGKVFYRVQTTDDCDSVLASNYGATMHLTVEAIPGNLNKVKWTAFDIEGADLTSYGVFKAFSGNNDLVDNVGPGVHSIDDSYNPADIAEAQACYHVVANFTMTAPDGEELNLKSYSNRACAEQRPRIFAPNAFAPEGFNQEFRPVIGLADLAAYKLQVYDRYGKEVFSTNQIEQGWDGKHKGKPLPQGLYAYIISVEQSSGKKSEKRGTVLLIK